MLHPCKFSWNPPASSWDIVQTRKFHADADANANADAKRIRTRNNTSPSPAMGDIIIGDLLRVIRMISHFAGLLLFLTVTCSCPYLYFGSPIIWVTYLSLGSWMTTCLESCSFTLPHLPFVNCCQCMYLVISLLVLRAGHGIWLHQFLIIAHLFILTSSSHSLSYCSSANMSCCSEWHSEFELMILSTR